MYNDIYEEFNNKDFSYDYPINFNTRTKDYLQAKEIPNVTWNYKDTVILSFNITDEEYSDVNDNICVSFYNFRDEIVYEKWFVPNNLNSAKISIHIDKDTSEEIFIPGVYHCGIQLLNAEQTEITTIMSPEDYCIYVK